MKKVWVCLLSLLLTCALLFGAWAEELVSDVDTQMSQDDGFEVIEEEVVVEELGELSLPTDEPSEEGEAAGYADFTGETYEEDGISVENRVDMPLDFELEASEIAANASESELENEYTIIDPDNIELNDQVVPSSAALGSYKTVHWICANYKGGPLRRLWFKKQPYAASENAGSIMGGLGGAKFKVKRLVENDYGNLWAETADNTYIYAGYKKVNGVWKPSPPEDLGQTINYDECLFETDGIICLDDNLSEVSFAGDPGNYILTGYICGSKDENYCEMPKIRVELYNTTSTINGEGILIDYWDVDNDMHPCVSFDMRQLNKLHILSGLKVGKYCLAIRPTYIRFIDNGSFGDKLTTYTKRFDLKNAFKANFEVTYGASNASSGSNSGVNPDSSQGNTGEASSQVTSGQWTYKVVTSDGLNMRDSAGTHGTLITTLWNPTTIAVSKKQSADGYTWGYGTSSNGYTGWIVVDNSWTTVVSAPVDTVPAKHTHSPITISGYAATCTKDGLTDGSKCSTCGEVLTAQKSIPAKGHSPQTVKGKAATCTAAGLTDGSKCSVCGEVLTAQKSIPAKGHSPQTVKGKAATCTAAGLTDGSKCSVCGVVLTAQKSIPATGHTPVGVAGYAPTYEAPGVTDGSYCAVCGVTLAPQQAIPQLEWPARVLEKNKNNGTVTVNLGEKVRLVPQFAYAAGAEVTGFKSGKVKVATVDGGGLVTALAEGKAKITVTTSNRKQKATITVVVVDPYKPMGIAIAQGKAITLTMGQPVQLGVGLTPATARATLTWKSNKAKVATVDGNGVVNPVGEGKAKITVTTHNKKKATIAVTVVDPYKPLGVSIAQGKTLTIKVNQTALLNAALNPASAQSALTWQSSKPSVVFVDSNGIIAGVKKGKAKITVTTYNKKKATITVNVVD